MIDYHLSKEADELFDGEVELDESELYRYCRRPKVKYECVYLHQFDALSQARTSLKEYFNFYNYERAHQSLDYHTRAQVYLINSSDNSLLYKPNSLLIV